MQIIHVPSRWSHLGDRQPFAHFCYAPELIRVLLWLFYKTRSCNFQPELSMTQCSDSRSGTLQITGSLLDISGPTQTSGMGLGWPSVSEQATQGMNLTFETHGPSPTSSFYSGAN